MLKVASIRESLRRQLDLAAQYAAAPKRLIFPEDCCLSPAMLDEIQAHAAAGAQVHIRLSLSTKTVPLADYLKANS